VEFQGLVNKAEHLKDEDKNTSEIAL